MTRIVAVLGCSLLLVAAVAMPLRGEALLETKARLLDDVKYLASDELEGRGPGTNGINLAAKFIKEQFAKAGLAVDRVADRIVDTLRNLGCAPLATIQRGDGITKGDRAGQAADLVNADTMEICIHKGSSDIRRITHYHSRMLPEKPQDAAGPIGKTR